jgi:plastocyanin
MIACLLLILTGCYSQPPAQTDISILMNSNSFQPANWRVPAGAAVTLHLTNQDAAAHQLMILYRQVVIPYGPADESSIFWSHSIAAGKSETIQFTAPAAAGDYDVIGADALQDGMVARLTVVRLDEIQP